MTEKKLVPKRRFEGFKGSWQKKKLKEFRDENDGYSFTGGPFGSDLKSEDYTTSGVRIIQLQNIGDGYFSNKYKIYTSEKKAKSLSTNLIYPNDIIIAKMADPLARAAIIPDIDSKYLMASDGIRLKVNTKKFHTYFLLTLINSNIFRRKALENSTGTTRKRIGLVTLGNISSNIPKYEEQQKIGEFFIRLDEMIALQQKKIDKTKALKSAYLAEMFPAEGERVPKRRFAGFTDEWELKPLSSIVGDISDGDWILKEHIFDEGKYRIIQTGNLGIGKYINNIENAKYFHEEDFNQLKANEIFPGDILISRLAEPAGRTVILPDTGFRMVTSVDIAVIRPDEKFDSIFFMTQMNSEGILNKISMEVTGTTHKRISRKNLEKIQLMIPEVAEQQKIGAFFKKLDDIIANHEQKLDKLQTTKQAYLNEMFV